MEARKVHIINTLNDYVAVVPSPISETVQASGDAKYKNEGVVVGIGTDVPAGLLKPGDQVVFRKNVYMMVKPDSGCYKDLDILFIPKPNLVLVKHGKQSRFEFVEGDPEVGD